MHVIKNIAVTMMSLWALSATGGALIDNERNAIRLMNYPPEAPCSLSRLAETDRAFGWGRVKYDNATNTCVITGDLIIGSNDGSETILKVGSSEHPDETLIMKGNIYIHPYFIEGENREHNGDYWRAPKRMNALILGENENKNITATLKFACSPDKRYTVYGGFAPWIKKGTQQGGGLYVYNSQIAPLNPETGNEIGSIEGIGMYLAGGSVFDNAKITGVKGALHRMGAGINKDFLVRNTMFTRVSMPLTASGVCKVSTCMFVDCETAVSDRGSLELELTDCVFRGNEQNWALTYSDNGLVCVDCIWDAPRKEDFYRVSVDNKGIKKYPKFSDRHQVTVKVIDDAGNPVADVIVSFKAEQAGCDLLQNREFRTDKDGMTPAKGNDGAIVMTEYVKTATEVPDKPNTSFFTYTVTARKNNKCGSIQNFKPTQSGEPVVLTLR
jgi:hypothetical protein